MYQCHPDVELLDLTDRLIDEAVGAQLGPGACLRLTLLYGTHLETVHIDGRPIYQHDLVEARHPTRRHRAAGQLWDYLEQAGRNILDADPAAGVGCDDLRVRIAVTRSAGPHRKYRSAACHRLDRRHIRRRIDQGAAMTRPTGPQSERLPWEPADGQQTLLPAPQRNIIEHVTGECRRFAEQIGIPIDDLTSLYRHLDRDVAATLTWRPGQQGICYQVHSIRPASRTLIGGGPTRPDPLTLLWACAKHGEPGDLIHAAWLAADTWKVDGAIWPFNLETAVRLTFPIC